MVVTEFDGFHRKVNGGDTSITTDVCRLPSEGGPRGIMLSLGARTVMLTHDEAIGLASDLLRAQQLASGGSG